MERKQGRQDNSAQTRRSNPALDSCAQYLNRRVSPQEVEEFLSTGGHIPDKGGNGVHRRKLRRARVKSLKGSPFPDTGRLYSDHVNGLGPLTREDPYKVDMQAIDIIVEALGGNQFFVDLYRKGGKTIGDVSRLRERLPDACHAIRTPEELLTGVILETPHPQLEEVEILGQQLFEASSHLPELVSDRLLSSLEATNLLDIRKEMASSYTEEVDLALSATGR